MAQSKNNDVLILNQQEFPPQVRTSLNPERPTTSNTGTVPMGARSLSFSEAREANVIDSSSNVAAAPGTSDQEGWQTYKSGPRSRTRIAPLRSPIPFTPPKLHVDEDAELQSAMLADLYEQPAPALASGKRPAIASSISLTVPKKRGRFGTAREGSSIGDVSSVEEGSSCADSRATRGLYWVFKFKKGQKVDEKESSGNVLGKYQNAP